MSLALSIGGIVKVKVEGRIPKSFRSYSESALSRLTVNEIDNPDIVIRFVNQLVGPPEDTPYNNPWSNYHILKTPSGSVGVPFCALDNEPGLPIVVYAQRVVKPGYLWVRIIEQLADLIATLVYGATFVHASAISVDGRGILFAALGRTGKTDLLLGFLLSRAGCYLSDDLSIISQDGRIHPYPRLINMLYYNVYSYPELLSILYPDWRGRGWAKVKMKIGRVSEWAETRKGFIWRGVHAATRHFALLRHLDAGIITKISPSAPISHVFLMHRTAEVEEPAIGNVLTPEQMASSLAANQILERIDFWSDYLSYVVASKGNKVKAIEQFRQKKEDVIFKSISKSTNRVLSLAQRLSSRNQVRSVHRIIKDCL